MMTMSARSRSPFTSIQWQELEQQALIFKYMISGVPIPPDLISTVKRSLESSLMSSRFFPHQPIGWGSFQMGFGRKADPEPGRCRRTDGKKWRCSKEAHPDSKYCERHMHRGRNRSRKPVELITSTNSNSSSSSAAAAAVSSSSSTITALSSAESYPFVYPQYPSSSSSSSRPIGSFLSPQNNATHHLFLDSGSSSSSLTERDHSNIGHGVRDGEVDGRAFFREASGSVRRSPPTPNRHSFTPWTMSSAAAGYSQLQFQSQVLTGNNSRQQRQHHLLQEEEEEKNKHCFILGTDFKSPNSSPPFKVEGQREEEKHKPFHHFFGEWAPKSGRDDVTAQQQNHSTLVSQRQSQSRANFSTTQLSISMPPSAYELFGSNSKSIFPADG